MTRLGHAHANPTKAFFVRMITRDIALEDCILDLVDNSIDAAWQLEGSKPMSLSRGANLSRYNIDIQATSEHFEITDNCGGITFDEAVDYAFTFGRQDTADSERFSIGVYGIGMKRAIFKMGNSIRIWSTYQLKSGKRESFLVPIDVDAWLGDPKKDNWDFNIESTSHLPDVGVRVAVSDLNEATSTQFSNPRFIRNLRKVLGRDYALHLHRGLNLTLNGTRIIGWQIELLESAKFKPARIEYTDKTEAGSVKVEILAGMAAPPPESSDPEDDEGENRFGWYVACNGRIVLAADRTVVAGWGTDGWPQWHPQYAGFLGIVLFNAPEASLLPLTTTKRNVEVSSTVYRRALPRMREITKDWIAYTNTRKQATDEAKRLEQAATAVPIFELRKHETVALPKLTPIPKEKPANINYSMPQRRVRALAKGFGSSSMTYREVGIQSFEYAYKDYVGGK